MTTKATTLHSSDLLCLSFLDSSVRFKMTTSSYQENFVSEENNEEDEIVCKENINIDDGETGSKRKCNPGASGAISQVLKKTKSVVWAHFTRLEENRDKCNCNYYGREMNCATILGTSNLKKHSDTCKQHTAWEQRKPQHNLNSGNGPSARNMQVGKISEAVFREASNEMLVLGELPLESCLY